MKTVLKRCSKCGIWGTLDDYSKDATKKGGLRSRCKACVREYYERNREQIRAYRRERYERNSEHERAYQREHRERNREQVLAYQREYRENNREQIRARNRERYERNLEHERARRREYHARNREQLRAREREHARRNRDLTRTLATRNNAPWTPEEDQQLLTLTETHTYYQIAVQLGRTQDSVNKRLRRLRAQGAA